MFSNWPFVPLSVRPSVRYQSCEREYAVFCTCKRMKRFCCKVALVVRGRGLNDRYLGSGDHACRSLVKVTCTTPKLDLDTWRRHHSRPLRSTRFDSFLIIFVTFKCLQVATVYRETKTSIIFYRTIHWRQCTTLMKANHRQLQPLSDLNLQSTYTHCSPVKVWSQVRYDLRRDYDTRLRQKIDMLIFVDSS